MTDVTIAHDEQGRTVVLRSIKELHAGNRQVRKQFEHGAAVLGQLAHPNIVRLLDVGELQNRPYMVVEYHEGLNLRERLARRWPGLHEHQLELVLQSAAALHHVHSRGFLHMDLKPENWVIRDDVRPILLDFDLAREHRGRSLRLPGLEGTPGYFAPETLASHTADEASEIFVFGVCMYELLTGHKPFEAATLEEYRRVACDPRRTVLPIRHHRDSFPVALESIILKCLAQQPVKRYPSMALVLRDLQALV